MNHSTNSVLQPFNMEINPVKKLVLFNFEKSPDTIYSGLELQWLDSPETGQGFRLIAYRTDEYVDVYDDTALIKQTGEGFDLIAPVGVSSSHPIYLPVFAMYDFDFIRKRKGRASARPL